MIKFSLINKGSNTNVESLELSDEYALAVIDDIKNMLFEDSFFLSKIESYYSADELYQEHSVFILTIEEIENAYLFLKKHYNKKFFNILPLLVFFDNAYCNRNDRYVQIDLNLK